MKKEISPKQQAVDLIKKSENILIITHVRPDGDAISSVAALKMTIMDRGVNILRCGLIIARILAIVWVL